MYGYQYNGKGRGQIYSLFKISESAHNDKQEYICYLIFHLKTNPGETIA